MLIPTRRVGESRVILIPGSEDTIEVRVTKAGSQASLFGSRGAQGRIGTGLGCAPKGYATPSGISRKLYAAIFVQPISNGS